MICILLFILLVIAFIMWLPFRTICLNFFYVIYNGCRDFYFNIMRHTFNTAPYGFIDCYCAEFGGGKTLSASARICSLYRKYNGKKVWHPELKRLVTQKIQILSNVELVGVPYIPLVSMEQFIKACDVKHDEDEKNNTLTITYLFGDEFSSQMNSRNFKSNIPSVLLNKILTSRHYFCSWFITSQRFNQVDKIIRDSTRYVIECRKTWRLLFNNYFYAWEMENCNNPLIMQPIKQYCDFVTDKMYNQYNTFACVDNLQEAWKKGEYMDDAEVLAVRCPATNDSGVVNFKKRFRRKQKRG